MGGRIFQYLRWKITLTISILFVLVLMIIGLSVYGQEQSLGQERRIDVRTFKNMPIKISEARNLQSKNWPRELELEIKNISSKPIYFIHVVIEFPDAPGPEPPAGAPPGAKTGMGFTLTYGNPELGDVRRLAGPDDVPINPGETYTFKLPESNWKGVQSMMSNGRIPPGPDKKLKIGFSHISFGDGTGFEAGRYEDYRSNTSPPLVPKSSFQADKQHVFYYRSPE